MDGPTLEFRPLVHAGTWIWGVHRCTVRNCRDRRRRRPMQHRPAVGKTHMEGGQRQNGMLQRGAAEFSALRSPSGALGVLRGVK